MAGDQFYDSTVQPAWTIAPDRPTLTTEVIHLWRADLNPLPLKLEALVQTLSADELKRAERFRFESDRRRFIVGRGTLRAILGRYLDTAPAQIQFRYAANGKPAIASPPAPCPVPHTLHPIPPIEFNLSHSHELMVCAVAQNCQVGIDLEHLRPVSDLEGLTQRFFAPQEHLAIQRLPVEHRERSFLQHWTCKEALLKATGTGLTELSHIEVAIANAEVQLVRSPQSPNATCEWLLHLFIPAPDYIAALAVKSLSPTQPPAQLVFMQWQNEDEG